MKVQMRAERVADAGVRLYTVGKAPLAKQAATPGTVGDRYQGIRNKMPLQADHATTLVDTKILHERLLSATNNTISGVGLGQTT